VKIATKKGQLEILLRENSSIEEIASKVYTKGEFLVDIKAEIESYLRVKMNEAQK
jgi:hypothetical protein